MKTMLLFIMIALCMSACGGGIDCEAGDPQWGNRQQEWRDKCPLPPDFDGKPRPS